jgi:hypothetical protein
VLAAGNRCAQLWASAEGAADFLTGIFSKAPGAIFLAKLYSGYIGVDNTHGVKQVFTAEQGCSEQLLTADDIVASSIFTSTTTVFVGNGCSTPYASWHV